jgi:hypothetical protein
MIKVATQSVMAEAANPSQVQRPRQEILGSDLRGQFVSAVYLWVDTENRIARYSASGHPPLVCRLCPDESNREQRPAPRYSVRSRVPNARIPVCFRRPFPAVHRRPQQTRKCNP